MFRTYGDMQYELLKIQEELDTISKKRVRLESMQVLIKRQMKNHPDHPACEHKYDNTYKCKKCGETK